MTRHKDPRPEPVELGVEIEKEKVYGRVRIETAYLAAKSQDAAAYDTMRAVQSDDELLDGHYADALAYAVVLLQRYTDGMEEADGKTTIHLSLPPDIDRAVLPAIGRWVENYVTRYVTGRWLSQFDAQLGAAWLAEAEATADLVRTNLNARSRPIRRRKSVF